MSERIGSSRAEAKALGLKHYRSKPCARHGDVLRYVSSKCCVKCHKERMRRREAIKTVPKYSRRIPAPTYVGKPCSRGHGTEKYITNNTCVECVKQNAQRRRSDPAVKEKIIQQRKAYHKKIKALGLTRQRRSQNRPPWVTPNMDQAYYNERNYRRDVGRPSEVDHFYPKNGHNFSGLDVPWNLIVIDKETNASKGNKHPRTFYGDDFEKMAKLVADTYEATLKEQTDAQYSIAA